MNRDPVPANYDAPFALDPGGLPEPPLAELAGWGRYPIVKGRERRSEDLERITRSVALTRGLGRSYGDASLPPPEGLVAGSPLADRILGFDPVSGVVRVEAGLSLQRLNRLFRPRGWFTPVTPGTHFVTLGGMVAADVHGKNHHVAGCLGEHVGRLRMRVAGGRVLECGEDCEPGLFRATLGGMGLTGHVLEVELRLEPIPSPWIWQESEGVADFDAALERLQKASAEWPFTVMWSDFLAAGTGFGRGLLMKGRWAAPEEAPREQPRWRPAPALPVDAPSWLLQRWLVAVGNRLNYWKHGRAARAGIIHPDAFFYPLDVLRDWNRAYGRRGFTQYQVVLPGPADHPRHRRFVRTLQARRAPVFLCVIKDCGVEGKGMLSFPKPGVSYALDLPIEAGTQGLVDALNDVAAAEGGRIYLAKDAFTRPEHFRAMEPRLEAWTKVRRAWDPEGLLKSAQSVRVLGDRP